MPKLSRRDVLVAPLAAGAALALPRGVAASFLTDRVLVPAGPFLKGTPTAQVHELARRLGYHPSWLLSEAPQQELWLPAFEIDRFPVTNQRYAEFCLDTGWPPPSSWQGPQPPAACLQHPVVMVDRADARAFAGWDGGALPTEAQWEKAARGTDGRAFPWGDRFVREACNFDAGGPVPPQGLAAVDAHPLGASPYGVHDMIGNAAEWCEDGPGPGSAYIKGGSWVTASLVNLRCAARGLSGFANNRAAFLGFRCVREV